MTDEESQMIRDLHDFWMKPPLEGQSSRADEVSELLAAMRAGKLLTRFGLKICALLIAISGAIVAMKALGK